MRCTAAHRPAIASINCAAGGGKLQRKGAARRGEVGGENDETGELHTRIRRTHGVHEGREETGFCCCCRCCSLTQL